jgi:RNA polymerase-binding transcription factor DksA
MSGLFLETVEGLGEAAYPGEMWELLQAEKESITGEIVADGSLRHDAAGINECEPWDDADEEMERRHRRALEIRLRELNDAQDRLIDGGYGLCIECGKTISNARLRADPAAAVCLQCRQSFENETLRWAS